MWVLPSGSMINAVCRSEFRLSIKLKKLSSIFSNPFFWSRSVRHHSNWNNQQLDLQEDLAHLVDNIKRRICDIASAGFPLFSVWSFLVVLKWPAHARSRRLRGWGYWCSHGIADGCNDRWTSRSALQGLPGRSSFPARCYFSGSDAIARSYLEFADDTAHALPTHLFAINSVIIADKQFYLPLTPLSLRTNNSISRPKCFDVS